METDQKPLVSIYKKHMIDISPKVQRLIVRSFPYLPFKVVYKKVVDIPVADALSRVTPMDPEDNIKLPTDLHEFLPHKEMLSIESGLITCGKRIIVPREMRPEMLQYIHEGHQGKECCLLGARNSVFWSKMTYDIQQFIEKCTIWKISATHRNYPGATPISMAHIGNRFVLLEKDGPSDSCRHLLQVHTSEEIAQFHLCSCVHRTVYDCHRVGFTSYNQELQWSMLQFQGVPTVPAMLQHHTPDKQPKSPKIQWIH